MPLNLNLAPVIWLLASLNIALWVTIANVKKNYLQVETLLATLFLAIDILLAVPITVISYSIRSLFVICLILLIVFITIQQAVAENEKLIISVTTKLYAWISLMPNKNRHKKQMTDL